MIAKMGEKLFTKAYGKQLVKIAREDLNSAIGLHKLDIGRKETMVYMVQQAIEKSLKSVLCLKEVPIPLVHDLGILVARMPDGVEPPYGYKLAEFNNYAGIIRYQLGISELTLEEVQAAISIAEEVLEWANAIEATIDLV